MRRPGEIPASITEPTPLEKWLPVKFQDFLLSAPCGIVNYIEASWGAYQRAILGLGIFITAALVDCLSFLGYDLMRLVGRKPD